MSLVDSLVIVYIATVILVPQGVWSKSLWERTQCYGELGCFSTRYPFTSAARPVSTTPSSPDFIRTQFVLYTRENPEHGQTLDARKIGDVRTRWTHFKIRKTQFIVHGFVDNYNIVSWLKDMKNELLTHGDYNTIIVDWHHGNLPPYTQATANTRVVGAQIAVLIKRLQSEFHIAPCQVHIIGHSLGAHIAGYAGEKTTGLGRISGLDPAGPNFSGTHKRVRLDASDALLVDNIHSGGNKILPLGGISEPAGHMDFYPNLGYNQPGCENLLATFFKAGIREFAACSHLRAIKFYRESINTKCPFAAVSCDSEMEFKTHKCHSSRRHQWASMGFKADEYRPTSGGHLKYYTTTADAAPFCRHHIDIIVQLANTPKATDERGIITVRLRGDKRLSNWLPLDLSPVVYTAGSTHERTLSIPYDVGAVSAIELKWHHKPAINTPRKWNLLGRRHPTIHLQEVQVMEEGERRQEVRFCTDDQGMESGKTESLNTMC